MKINLFLFSLLLTTRCSAQSDVYLSKVAKYNEASVFEDAKYKDMTWQKFYQLEEVQEFVDPNNYDFDLLNAAVLFATNKYRASKGIAALRFDPRLRDAAAIHTNEMVNRKFFDHLNTASPRIRMPNNRTELCGFEGARIAENLERDFMDVQKPMNYAQLGDKAIQDLSRSRDHDAHLLDKNLDQVGCALLFENQPNTDGYWFWRLTQNFGKSW